MAESADFYRLIKMFGVITLIPLVLLAGSLTGYWVGEFLMEKFNFGAPALMISLALGLLSGILEAIRLIRFLIKIDKQKRITNE